MYRLVTIVLVFILIGCAPKTTTETIRIPLMRNGNGEIVLEQIDVVTSTRDPWGINTRRTQSWLVENDFENNVETVRMIGAPGDFGGNGAANNALPAALISGGHAGAAPLYKPHESNTYVNQLGASNATAGSASESAAGSSSEAGANAESASNQTQNQGQEQKQHQDQQQHMKQEQNQHQEKEKRQKKRH